jgi:predicted ribosomally synthesized peptide with SipW-like signal peptide
MRGLRYRHVRASAGRTSSTWRLKKILASLIAIGALSSVTVTGTFALLSSQETSTGSSVASGTLTFSNTVGTGTACLSYSGPASPGNVNTGCDALITSATLNYPGVALTPVKVTIANNGSLDAASLSVYMPSCTAAATPGAPSPGGANPCAAGGAQFTIQETNSAGVATACRYPSGPVTCVFSANSLQLFAANANTVTSAVNLGSGPAHGQSRYFLIGLELPSTAGNALQGEEAVFALTWHVST